MSDPSVSLPGGGGTMVPVGSGLHRPSGRAGLGFALTLITVLLWGALPVGLQIALAGMDPLTLTWYRFVAATLLLGTILLVRQSFSGVGVLGPTGWRLLVVATLCLSANYILYVVGLHRTNASTAQVVIQIAPVLLALGGVWVFMEHFGITRWLGLTVMIAGLLLFSHAQVASIVLGASDYYIGVGCVVAAAVTWAGYGLAQKQLLHTMPSSSIMLCIYGGAAIVFTPLARPGAIAEMTRPQLAALVFCAVNTLAAYGTFAEALAHWEASRVSAVLALVPLVTFGVVRLAPVLMPGLLDPEPMTASSMAGACLVVAGALITALTQNEKEKMCRGAAPADTEEALT